MRLYRVDCRKRVSEMVLKQVLLDFSLSIRFNTKNKYDSLFSVIYIFIYISVQVKRDGFGGGFNDDNIKQK